MQPTSGPPGSAGILDITNLESLSRNELRRVLQQPNVRDALKRVVRFGKAERVGIGMMDIMVCGAVAPYNAIFRGELACLPLGSPEVVRAYSKKYEDHVKSHRFRHEGEESTRSSSARSAMHDESVWKRILADTTASSCPLRPLVERPPCVCGTKSLERARDFDPSISARNPSG